MRLCEGGLRHPCLSGGAGTAVEGQRPKEARPCALQSPPPKDKIQQVDRPRNLEVIADRNGIFEKHYISISERVRGGTPKGK